jgi:hypothetical protein
MLKNKKDIVIKFIKENKWILLVSLLFVAWKFFLISVFFNNEFSKSEEPLAYTSHINSINQCSYLVFCKQFLSSLENYTGFAYLSYRLFFGFIGHLLRLDSTSVFHLSFYIGILMLLPSLILFLKNIETDKKIIAFLLFFLTLYNGGGSHGFWWVVPDFFAILLIFITFAIIIGNYKHWKLILFILMPVGLYTHTMFVYLMTTPVFFYIFYSFFTKNIDLVMLRKIAFSIFILAIFYVPTSYHLDGNPYGPETYVKNSNIITSSVQSLKGDSSPSPTLASEQKNYSNRNLFPGFHKLRDRYFNWIFFSPVTPIFNIAFDHFLTFIAVILFIYVLFVLFYYKKYKILSFYFAALIYILVSSINKHADRSLAFIWPITFLLYAYGVWFSFKLADEVLKNRTVNMAIKALLCLSMVIFIVINLIYSYGMNQSIYFNPLDLLK